MPLPNQTDGGLTAPSVTNTPPEEDSFEVNLFDLLIWIGRGKWFIGGVTAAVTLTAAVVAFTISPIFTARTTLLAPGSQQQNGSAATLAALGALGGLTGGNARTSDELYSALLKSDSVARALDSHFQLQSHYKVKDFESLRKVLPGFVRIAADKRSGIISLEVDDEDPRFAADLANAHPVEVGKMLSRLAVTEAQQRRFFFEQQMKDAKERLVKAETDLRLVQERSGMIVLDKQAEVLIQGAAQVRGAISEREIRLRVLRTGATEQNPDVMRLMSELQGLRAELERMESRQATPEQSSAGIPVGKIPEASVDFVRARRELRLQEVLLDAMVRQFEAAKLDEAKESPVLQQVDIAVPPDRKSRPARAQMIVGSALVGLFCACLWVVIRGYTSTSSTSNAESIAARAGLRAAWRLRSR